MCELLTMSCRHPTRLTSLLTALGSHAQGKSRNRNGWGMVELAKLAGVLRCFWPANFLYSDGDTLFAHADRHLQPSSGLVEPLGFYWLTCPMQSSSELLEKPHSPQYYKGQRVILTGQCAPVGAWQR